AGNLVLVPRLETGAPGTGSPEATPLAVPTTSLLRGPYLQMGTPTSIIIRWRTSEATDSVVLYGFDPNGLSVSAGDPNLTKEHLVRLTGLRSGTRYYYSIGSSVQTLASGSDCTFVTAPTTGTQKAMRIWVLGDSGTASSDARTVRDAFNTF